MVNLLFEENHTNMQARSSKNIYSQEVRRGGLKSRFFPGFLQRIFQLNKNQDFNRYERQDMYLELSRKLPRSNRVRARGEKQGAYVQRRRGE